MSVTVRHRGSWSLQQLFEGLFELAQSAELARLIAARPMMSMEKTSPSIAVASAAAVKMESDRDSAESLAARGPLVSDAALFEVWTATRALAAHWAARLAAVHSPNASGAAPAPTPRLWSGPDHTELTPLAGSLAAHEFQQLAHLAAEILAGEMVLRVWGTRLAVYDRQYREARYRPIVEHMLQQVLPLRLRVFQQVLAAGDLLEVADRLRRRCERWTDSLLGPWVVTTGVSVFAHDQRRAWEFGEDHAGAAAQDAAEALFRAGYRAAFRGPLTALRPTAEPWSNWLTALVRCEPEANAFAALRRLSERAASSSSSARTPTSENRQASVATDAWGAPDRDPRDGSPAGAEPLPNAWPRIAMEQSLAVFFPELGPQLAESVTEPSAETDRSSGSATRTTPRNCGPDVRPKLRLVTGDDRDADSIGLAASSTGVDAGAADSGSGTDTLTDAGDAEAIAASRVTVSDSEPPVAAPAAKTLAEPSNGEESHSAATGSLSPPSTNPVSAQAPVPSTTGITEAGDAAATDLPTSWCLLARTLRTIERRPR